LLCSSLCPFGNVSILVGVSAVPVLDISKTAVGLVHSATPDHHHFMVSVVSLDEYFSLKGEFVGEQISRVSLSFDLDEHLKVSLYAHDL
jgi:hypothetical protein